MNQIAKHTIVPLELINLQGDGFHLLVEVVVFGQKFPAVLDTGASKTVFDKTTVEAYPSFGNLLLSDKLSTGLGTNSMESHTITLPSLKIGQLTLKDFEIAVLDLSTINVAYEALGMRQVVGVVGSDILYSHAGLINYKKLNLKLSLTSS